jgi:hypothetical protein
MTHKDHIFAKATEGLSSLQLDDGYRVVEVTRDHKHSCRIRVQRVGSDPLVEGPCYFRVRVTEEQ